MYAVIKAGGKQQRVKPGDVIEIELMRGQHGEEVEFAPLLVVDDDGTTHVGRELGRAVVRGKLVGEEKGDKVRVFKYRPKSGYARRRGHRQMYTLVEIQDVTLGRRAGQRKSERPAPQEAPAPEEVGATEVPEETGAAELAPEAEHPSTAEAAVPSVEEEVEGGSEAPSPRAARTRSSAPRRKPAEGSEEGS